MDLEEFGCASVETHALALVKLGFAVVIGNALFRTGFGESSRQEMSERIAHPQR